jgi:hypothetical protein
MSFEQFETGLWQTAEKEKEKNPSGLKPEGIVINARIVHVFFLLFL